eukprot:251081-Alexandrium_andersonii.AAC.1
MLRRSCSLHTKLWHPRVRASCGLHWHGGAVRLMCVLCSVDAPQALLIEELSRPEGEGLADPHALHQASTRRWTSP